VQCTRLTPQLLQAVARLPLLADLNLAQFDLAAASRCENMLNWQLLYTLAAMTSLTALDLSHVMIQEQQARPHRAAQDPEPERGRRVVSACCGHESGRADAPLGIRAQVAWLKRPEWTPGRCFRGQSSAGWLHHMRAPGLRAGAGSLRRRRCLRALSLDCAVAQVPNLVVSHLPQPRVAQAQNSWWCPDPGCTWRRCRTW